MFCLVRDELELSVRLMGKSERRCRSLRRLLVFRGVRQDQIIGRKRESPSLGPSDQRPPVFRRDTFAHVPAMDSNKLEICLTCLNIFKDVTPCGPQPKKIRNLFHTFNIMTYLVICQ